MVAEPCEVGPVAVEYLVRAARVTDIDRVVALSDHSMPMGRAESPLGAADLFRQLVYLPQASIVVAEVRRTVVGGAILALTGASHDMTVPAELRDRAGRANPSLKESM